MADHNEAMRQHDRDSRELRELCAQRDAARETVRKQAERIAELEARVHTCGPTCSKAGCINRRITAERDTLRAELETERMRLVACGVVAMANTAESAAKARDMHPDYLCASVRDVAAAVDREMALRAEVERLRVNAERYRWLRSAHWSDAPLCCVLEPKVNVRLGATCPSGDQLDTAIDTARKATQ